MKAILIAVTLTLVAALAQAQEVSKTDAYATCAVYIENQVSRYKGTDVPPRHNYRDEGATHWLWWNMKFPIYLANQYGGKRKTGAVCEVDKKTGQIVYLAVSAREIIK